MMIFSCLTSKIIDVRNKTTASYVQATEKEFKTKK